MTRPNEYVFNTVGLILGSLVTYTGIALLTARLWEKGERLWTVLGGFGFAVSSMLWLPALLFRFPPLASGMGEAFASVETQLFNHIRSSNELFSEVASSWVAFVYLWVYAMSTAHKIVAFLATAAYGAALLYSGWSGRIWARIFMVFGLAGPLVIIASRFFITIPFMAALFFVFTIPFFVFIMPYFMGVNLLLQGKQQE